MSVGMGPSRRSGNRTKVWKEPLILIYGAVSGVLIIAALVRIIADR